MASEDEVPIDDNHESNEEESDTELGFIFFQTESYTEAQMKSISRQYQSREDLKQAPKMLYSDTDQDATQKWWFDQAKIMGNYDKNNIAFPIITQWFTPTNYGPFKQWINFRFLELRQHLLNGCDIIIPYPSQQDINDNKSKYYDNDDEEEQVIFHNIMGNNIPFEDVEYIQNKIDELKSYSSGHTD